MSVSSESSEGVGGKRPPRRGTFFSFATRPAVLVVAVAFVGFILHPKWMNIRLYFGSSEELIPMNFVSNFYLWTRSNYDEPERLVVGAAERLSHTHFAPRTTYVLIHGFTRTGLENWIINMKNALLWREDCNVVSVDWEAGSLSVGYYVVKERVSQVGEDVSKLVEFVRSQPGGLKGGRVHLIGHSLGAHVAGFAGKHFNGTLDRITGLDPAGLAYNGASAHSRLDPGDARFVDVIHTHGCYTLISQFTNCYGTYDNLGHADFWPNGGEYQPACDEDGDGHTAVRKDSNCHHGLAYVYYTESIKYYSTSTRFLARRCPSYDLFNNNSCDCPTVPQYMGYNVNTREHGVFYLNTSKTKPYAMLDPLCSPTHYSTVKILGLAVCIPLVLFGLIYSILVLGSIFMNKDLLQLWKLKWSESFLSWNLFKKT